VHERVLQPVAHVDFKGEIAHPIDTAKRLALPRGYVVLFVFSAELYRS
jgi:hypothetical protein